MSHNNLPHRISALRAVSSRDNATVKRFAALAKSAPARKRDGMCLLEGEHLAQSYVQSGGTLTSLALRAASDASATSLSPAQQSLIAASRETILLAPPLFDGLSTLASPSGVLAMASVPVARACAVTGFVLALDAVQDPGNVGTLIRTAAAAGAHQVWLSPGCAFAWSVKTLRASQGAHFHLDVIEEADLSRVLAAFRGERWATLPRALPGMNAALAVHHLSRATFGRDVALVLSNEGAGLSKSLYPVITHGLNVPMKNGVESLNVATAGALALYEVSRKIDQ
jgi:RNA methyltransferase, TrmH family